MAQKNEEQTSVKDESQQHKKGLDDPPYTIKNIFLGAFLRENMKDFYDAPKTKDFLLPFQDKEQWIKIRTAFSETQPNIDDKRTELKYLTGLFQKLGEHKASKLCNWLNLIRQYGTSGAIASMDISQIGKKCKLSKEENAQQIYTTFFNKTLPFIKKLIQSMPKIFVKSSNDNNKNEEKSNDNDSEMKNDNDNDTEIGNKDKKEDNDSNDKYIKLFYQNPGSNSRITLTRGQIASLLACCFLGISIYPHCSFHGELNAVGTPGKLEMWIRYFDYVRQKGIESDWFNKEKVTIWRRSLKAEDCDVLEHDNLVNNNKVLANFTVFEEGCIEDQAGQLHADFANQFIGGGVLEGGNVQEEIRFTVNTECIISKLLNPLAMKHNEAIIILGSQQFFDYSGYGSSFSFDGYRNVKEEMFFCDDAKDRLGSSAIIGIDAIYFFAPKNQILVNRMMREIAKSYVGFSIDNKDIGHKMDIISTGNWGCGIFRGDPTLKAVLQWISITLSGRSVAYYTFKDRRVANGQLDTLIKGITKKKVTVGQLWKVLSNSDFIQEYKQGGITIATLLWRDLELE